jgi:hypothetical protein
LLRLSQSFRAALPFSDKLALAVLKSELAAASGPEWSYHVTLNCFDGSAHMFFFSMNNDRRRTALLRKTMFLASA